VKYKLHNAVQLPTSLTLSLKAMKLNKTTYILSLIILVTGFYSCSNIPEGAVAVKSFDKEKYLGKWYEIARLDFKYEKDLDNTTANYSVNNDQTIKVVNRGFNTKTGKWKEVMGKAKLVGEENVAMLKVSFFGPFYAGYNVIALDEEYKYALVVGRNLNYLWILSRETTIPEEIKLDYLKIAENIGYKTADLIWVNHD